MSVYVQCFYQCFGLSGGSNTHDIPSKAVNEPVVSLDTQKMGNDSIFINNLWYF